MWDMPENDALIRLIAEVYEKGGVIGAVCHGPAGLVGVRLDNGEPLVKGRTVNCFTDEEEKKAEKDEIVPFLLESELRNLGAKFEKSPPFEKKVVRDGRLVTGQNPASAEGVAQEMLSALSALQSKAAE